MHRRRAEQLRPCSIDLGICFFPFFHRQLFLALYLTDLNTPSSFPVSALFVVLAYPISVHTCNDSHSSRRLPVFVTSVSTWTSKHAEAKAKSNSCHYRPLCFRIIDNQSPR
ncbi:Chaperone protein TorD [Trichinella spiralis]|uniref:Chaperone protein TorD n=1 Tax=Trichinella spiralis TaxID=6334 RepID=A0ABR3KZ36_TRISP